MVWKPIWWRILEHKNVSFSYSNPIMYLVFFHEIVKINLCVHARSSRVWFLSYSGSTCVILLVTFASLFTVIEPFVALSLLSHPCQCFIRIINTVIHKECAKGPAGAIWWTLCSKGMISLSVSLCLSVYPHHYHRYIENSRQQWIQWWGKEVSKRHGFSAAPLTAISVTVYTGAKRSP